MQPGNSHAFTILIVDDRPENILSLEEILDQPGRHFIRAGSGNEALKQALKTDNLGLILLDVQMPDMDGFEVAHILKSNSRTKDISIIFVTAISKEEKYMLKGFEEGAVDYLHKPLDVNITRAKVNVFERLYFAQFRLSQALDEVAQINKQLERFMYIVSHDLKSPLASMRMIADLLLSDTRIKEHADLDDQAGIIAQASDRLIGMINSILEYSRQSASQQTMEEVDTHALVKETVELLRIPGHFRVTVDPALPRMFTKKIKLQQVFQNLISNAVKYNDKTEAMIEIGVAEKDNRYQFHVKDNGPGIIKQDQDRIFKIFETTDNETHKDSATGVGLNLLKVIVEEQGGTIWVNSEKGTGSTFYFTWQKRS
ncbi:sensor histidine kinase [Sediminibacterium soli]|uniref:sensor histidine kinase n=1 Tax=Sediminibacterium soli TaxID=2698829 RepID=UPI00137A72ED|nr:hybrid sensor histidine kinase/response regulator [Sediminibacterium soli]NCI46595.1 hybrid sensor histidine kinase/response regulator [Sediminibacterium soli]